MKTFKTIAIPVLCIGLLFGATSCVVFVKENNGRHKGWFRNSNNPHHPHHLNSSNPGKSRGKPGK